MRPPSCGHKVSSAHSSPPTRTSKSSRGGAPGRSAGTSTLRASPSGKRATPGMRTVRAARRSFIARMLASERMQPVLVLDVVGLTPRQIGARTPHLAALARRGACAPLEPVLPAVTLPVQATLLTGLTPGEHGAGANGWYFGELGEGILWGQASERLQ